MVDEQGTLVATRSCTDAHIYCDGTSGCYESVAGPEQVVALDRCDAPFACVAQGALPACAVPAACDPMGTWRFELEPGATAFVHVERGSDGKYAFSWQRSGAAERTQMYANDLGACSWSAESSDRDLSLRLIFNACADARVRLSGVTMACDLRTSDLNCTSVRRVITTVADRSTP